MKFKFRSFWLFGIAVIVAACSSSPSGSSEEGGKEKTANKHKQRSIEWTVGAHYPDSVWDSTKAAKQVFSSGNPVGQWVLQDSLWGLVGPDDTLRAEAQFSKVGNFYDSLARVREDSLYGFMNPEGEMVIGCQYSRADPFVPAYAKVTEQGPNPSDYQSYLEETGPSYFIDRWGEKLPQFSSFLADNSTLGVLARAQSYVKPSEDSDLDDDYLRVQLRPFRNGLAAAKRGGKWGFVSAERKLVRDFEFEQVGQLHQEIVPVEHKRDWYFLWFYLEGGHSHWDSALLERFAFEQIKSFGQHKTAWVRDDSGWALAQVVRKHRPPAPPTVELITRHFEDVGPFSGGLARVVLNRTEVESWQPKGTPPAGGGWPPGGPYQTPHTRQEALATGATLVGPRDRLLRLSWVGYMDRKGNWAIEPQACLAAGDFHDGRAPIYRKEGWEFIDKQGNTVIEGPLGDVTFRNAESPDFSPPRFSEDLAAVVDPESGLFGYIGTEGHWQIKPQFPMARNFHNGRAWVGGRVIQAGGWPSLGDSLQVINKKGETLCPPKYDEHRLFRKGRAAVFIREGGWDNMESYGRWGFIDRQGREIVAPQYTENRYQDPPPGEAPFQAPEFKGGYAGVKAPDGQYYKISRQGEKTPVVTFPETKAQNP